MNLSVIRVLNLTRFIKKNQKN